MNQGPCAEGEWLEQDEQEVTSCKPSPCPRADGRHIYWNKSGRPGCYKSYTRGPCPPGQLFVIENLKAGQARCVTYLHEEYQLGNARHELMDWSRYADDLFQEDFSTEDEPLFMGNFAVSYHQDEYPRELDSFPPVMDLGYANYRPSSGPYHFEDVDQSDDSNAEDYDSSDSHLNLPPRHHPARDLNIFGSLPRPRAPPKVSHFYRSSRRAPLTHLHRRRPRRTARGRKLPTSSQLIRSAD